MIRNVKFLYIAANNLIFWTKPFWCHSKFMLIDNAFLTAEHATCTTFQWINLKKLAKIIIYVPYLLHRTNVWRPTDYFWKTLIEVCTSRFLWYLLRQKLVSYSRHSTKLWRILEKQIAVFEGKFRQFRILSNV